MDEGMKVATKEIRLSDKPIVDMVYEAVLQYKLKWHQDPDGILLGPNEYMQFELEARDVLLYTVNKAGGYPIRFLDIVVYPMTRGGIDMIPRRGIVGYFALGKITGGV